MDFNVTYRAALPEDAKELVYINLVTWLDTYVNDQYGVTKELLLAERGDPANISLEKIASLCEQINDKSKYFHVAVLGDKVVGYVSSYVNENGKQAVGSIYVLPEYQRAGIGSKLINMLLGSVGECDVEVEVASYNSKALSFYKKYGFVETNEVSQHKIGPSGKAIPVVKLIKKGGN